MSAKRAWACAGRLISVLAGASCLAAADYRGVVTASGLPVPGVTVTATQEGRKLITTTDERGAFQFPGLSDGAWAITLEMVGFARLSREVRIERNATASQWELKFLPAETPATGGAAAPRARAAPGARFQRLEVSQSAETNVFSESGTIRTEEAADLTQSAANSFLVQGSMSSALGLERQNDWGFGPGPGMPPMGPPGLGGPGGPGGFAGLEGPAGAGGPGGPVAAGGPGGPAFDRGRPGAGPGGPGGGFGGGPGGGFAGGPGGGFGGGPGGGGPGGPGGMRPRERGAGPRPDWQGRSNAMAFGNARRNPRNSYMGMASFSLGNSALDAKSYSVTGASIDKPAYANARGSVMFGGPLRIPKLVSPEKQIFFSINYHIQRSRTGVTSEPVNMPAAQERSGDFSAVPATIFDPATGAPFPGNRIPATRINPAAAALLKYFPDPNLPFAARNYQTSWSGVSNSHGLNARLMNVRISGKDRLNGGIGYQGSHTVSPNLFHFVDTGSGRGVNASLGWSRNITPRLINTVQYTFSRNRQLSSPYFANLRNVAAELNIAGTSEDPRNWGPPNLSFVNYAGLTDGNFTLNRNQTGSVRESLMWIRGSHRYSFGGDYRRQQFNQLADTNGRGTYSFNGSATSFLVNGIAQNGTGYDLADFLLGVPATASIRYGNADKYFRGSGHGVFVNDDWRIRPDLSLTAGLRWDYATPVQELYGRLVNLEVAPGFAAVAPVPARAPGSLPGALIRPDRNNISPRFGLAWRPRSKGSMVVRTGYGVYYNTSVYNLIAANMAQQPPFARVLSASNSAAAPLGIESGLLLASSAAAQSTYAVDPNYAVGYAQTWSVSVQQDLPLGMFGTIGYLGTKGTRLDQLFLPNSVPPGARESALPHGFLFETSNGNSIYHAAQFQLVRRFRSGIGAHAAYQFSKSIDNAGTGGRGQGGTPVAQNWLDLSAERGLSSFDARHNLSLQFQYSTGMGRAGGALLNGWRGALGKDWTVSGSISLRSGTPLTATVGGNRSQVAGTGVTNTVRADATGLPVKTGGTYFNPEAFVAPPAGQWGNAGRNTIPGPATFTLNGSIGRIFPIGERRNVDLQMQAQNLLNHVTITRWGTVVGANNYGLATGAAEMRKVTANLRFRF